MRELTKLAQLVGLYREHDKKRLTAVIRGDGESARLQHKAALSFAREAFNAGFTLHEFFREIERHEE